MRPVVETTEELRRICQVSREQLGDGYEIWGPERRLYRSLSIHVTRACLKLGVSGNTATFVSYLAALIGGILLIFGSPTSWMIALLFLYLFGLLDCTDGEICRYNHTSSAAGHFLDRLGASTFWPFVQACAVWGTFAATGNPSIFIAGFIMIWNSVEPIGVQKETACPPEKLGRLLIPVRLCGRWLVHNYFGFAFAAFLAAIIDTFLGKFEVGDLAYNARYVYLTGFAIANLGNRLIEGISVYANLKRAQRH